MKKTSILSFLLLFLFIGTAFSQTRTQNFTLNWTDNSTNETGFGLERSKNNGTFALIFRGIGANVVQYIDSITDIEGSQFCWRVFAFNATDESTRSNPACSSIPVSIPTGPNNLLGVLNTNNSVTLTWVDNSDNEVSFKIQRKIGASGTYQQIGTVGANVKTFTDTPPVVSNAQYFYRVTASNTAGDSVFSNEVNVTIPSQAPVAPTNLTVQVTSSTGARLNWQDSNTQITRTDVYRRRSNQSYTFIASVSPTALAYADNNLRRNTSYCWTVRDVNESVLSPFSSPACVHTPR